MARLHRPHEHLQEGLAVLLSMRHKRGYRRESRRYRVCLECGGDNRSESLYFCSESCSRAFAEAVEQAL